jgi:uridine phosphorylase
VRLDGASTHYAPIELPAVRIRIVVQAAAEAAAGLGVPFRTGVSASTDTFYPGQERYDSFSGYVPRRFQGITEEWRRLHVLNYEMESSTVLTLTAAMGLRGGCVAGVVVNRPGART